MKLKEDFYLVEGVLKKMWKLLSQEERNAIMNLMALVQHEFDPADDDRKLIDDHICSIRWTKKDIEEVIRENGLDVTEDDITEIISRVNFARWLKECCEEEGSAYIIRESEDYLDKREETAKMSVEKLILQYIGKDNNSRSVYTYKGELFVDVARKGEEPQIFTKLNNQFDGAADSPIQYLKRFEGATVEFYPERVACE